MRCKICNRNFKIKRSFCNLLEKPICFVCDSCYKKYPIQIGYEIIPINNHLLHVYTMFNKVYHLTNDPFMLEYGKIYDYLLKKYPKEPVLMYQKLRLNSYELANIEHISKLFDSDIIILCYFIEEMV